MNLLAENCDFEDVEYERHAARAREVMRDTLQPGFENPCFFVDLEYLRNRLRLFQERFMPGDSERTICYAMKSNPHEEILKTLVADGIDGFDCASIPEVNKVLSLKGMGAKNVFYNNPIRTHGDVVTALFKGVKYYTAQSRSGIDKILRNNFHVGIEDLEIAVRLESANPDADVNLSETQKFGCTPEVAVELVKHIKDSGAKAGLSIHTGSQNRNPQTFERAVKSLREIAEKSGGISSANFGGGFPVNYFSSTRFDAGIYLDVLTQAIRSTRFRLADGSLGPIRSIVEPGRAIIAPTADLAVLVSEIDTHRGKKRMHINDGLFTSFMSSLTHDWQYEFGAISPDDREFFTPETYSIFGRACDSVDFLGELRLPGGLKEGDYLHVRTAGAYMDCQSTEFNGFKGAKHVFY